MCLSIDCENICRAFFAATFFGYKITKPIHGTSDGVIENIGFSTFGGRCSLETVIVELWRQKPQKSINMHLYWIIEPRLCDKRDQIIVIRRNGRKKVNKIQQQEAAAKYSARHEIYNNSRRTSKQGEKFLLLPLTSRCRVKIYRGLLFYLPPFVLLSFLTIRYTVRPCLSFSIIVSIVSIVVKR